MHRGREGGHQRSAFNAVGEILHLTAPCPPIHWQKALYAGTLFASLDPAGVKVFAKVGACVGPLTGQWLVIIERKGRPDRSGRAGSLDQAKRFAEQWARRHWKSV